MPHPLNPESRPPDTHARTGADVCPELLHPRVGGALRTGEPFACLSGKGSARGTSAVLWKCRLMPTGRPKL